MVSVHQSTAWLDRLRSLLHHQETGKYSEEEFDIAHATFLGEQKPHIYTYFKNVPIGTGSITEEVTTLLAFKKKLSDLGHYYTHYTSTEDLKLQFQEQLDKLFETGKL